MIQFTDSHTDVVVIVQGSTPSRIRYYSMGISKHLEEITREFEIWGALSENKWELFQKNQTYKALLGRRKKFN